MATGSKSFQIIGLDEINRLFQGLPQAVNTIFQNMGSKHTQIVYDKAYKIVPVKTGRLRSSIGKKVTPQEAQIYATAPYAAAVHFGSRGRPGRPFLYGPFDEQIDPWLKEIDNEIMNYLRSG